MRAIGRWVWTCLGCLVLLVSCTVSRGRLGAYRDLAAWLGANALPDENIAVQEPRAWMRLTPMQVVALPSGGDAAALLAELMAARPDYCVALRSVAWQVTQAAPWFQARYREVAVATAASDSASPLTLYSYRPSPFDAGETVRLGRLLEVVDVGRLELLTLQLSSSRLAKDEPIYVSLTAAGDVREPLTAVWELIARNGGRVWNRSVQTQLGGLPTDEWPRTGSVLEQRAVAAPIGIPPGEYVLELAFLRANLAPFGEPTVLAVLSVPPDIAQVRPMPDHVLDLQAGDAVKLVGYDLAEYLGVGEPLRITLYWHARTTVGQNLKTFVHVLGPDGALVAQSDTVPVAWTYPTLAWQPGDYIRDVHVIAADSGLPWGEYRIVAGMYDPETRIRVSLRDAQGMAMPDDLAQLGALRVR